MKSVFNRLPIRIALHADETPLSFTSRLAKSLGFKCQDEFWSLTGLSPSAVRSGASVEMSLLEESTGFSQQELSRFAIKPGEVIEYGSAVVSRWQLHRSGMRVCTECLLDDLRSLKGRPETRPYVRGVWAWTMVACCDHHGVPLLKVPRGATYADDIASWAGTLEADKSRNEIAAEEVHPADSYFASRLVQSGGTKFLDTLPAYVAAELCTILGRLEHVGAGYKSTDPVSIEFREFKARFLGFEIASQGVSMISEFLTDYVRKKTGQVPQHRLIYYPALQWLKDKVGNSDYATVINLFQEHAENHIPLEKGEVFLTEVQNRRFHTIKGAALEYGLPEDRIRLILEAREDVSCVRSAPLGEIAFFDCNDAHRWLIEAKETFTVPEVAATLRCPAAVMEAVIELGLLKFAANDLMANRIFRRVSKDAVEAFRQKMSELMTCPSPDDGMVSLSRASAFCHCTVAEILSLLFDGKLTRVAKSDGEIGLDVVYVDPMEISPLVELRDSVGLLDIKTLERKLRTTTATVYELLKRELLPFVVRRHRTTRVAQRFVAPEAVQHFLGEYISLSTIARESGLQIAAVKDHLDKRGVRPIFEPTGKIARFYPKSEIERLGMI